MIDKYGRPNCDKCGSFVKPQSVTLPDGTVLGPEDAALILCPECAAKMLAEGERDDE